MTAMFVTDEELQTPTPLTVDDTGTLNCSFRVTSVRKGEDGVISYELEVSVTSTDIDEGNAKDAVTSAMKESTRVRTQIQPFPG